jgi:hypothetical protein
MNLLSKSIVSFLNSINVVSFSFKFSESIALITFFSSSEMFEYLSLYFLTTIFKNLFASTLGFSLLFSFNVLTVVNHFLTTSND